MSIELLLDRFGQSNKLQKKSKGKFRDIQHMDIVPKTCFQGSLEDVLRTFWGRPISTFQVRPLEVRLGRPQDSISKRPQNVRWGHHCDGQIRSLVDVLRTSEWDVLGTSWQPIFAGWVVTELFVRDRKLNISHVFITQSYFAVPKYIRVYSIHYFIMKIPNKRQLQQIAFNKSSDIDFKDLMNF